MLANTQAPRPAVAALLTCLAIFSLGAASARAQTETPRRQRGPVAGPSIKLPRGEGATSERDAAKDEGARAQVQKWEYCAITGIVWRQKGFNISSPQTPAAVVRFFPTGHEEVEGSNEEDALANAFARLGDDGWELAGMKFDLSLTDGSGKGATTYFFKRPKKSE